MRRSRSPIDPLAPLEIVVKVAAGLIVAWLLLLALGSMAGWHASFGAWGDSYPCVTTPDLGLWISGPDAGERPPVDNLRPGVEVGTPTEFELCSKSMSTLDRSLLSVPAVVDILWTLGFLAMTLMLIRRARRHGLFTRNVAQATIGLGWYLLAGSILLDVVKAVTTPLVVSHLVEGYRAWLGTLNAVFDLNPTIIIAGLGVISFGLVMRQAVAMQDDLDGTV